MTKEQRALLDEFGIAVSEDVNRMLLDLDSKITAIGFDVDYSLNDVGRKLQKLYDELYAQGD